MPIINRNPIILLLCAGACSAPAGDGVPVPVVTAAGSGAGVDDGAAGTAGAPAGGVVLGGVVCAKI